MKKLIVGIVSVILILSAAACQYGNETNNENLLGTWELESVSVRGVAVDLTVDSSAMIPYDYSFTFSSDGRATADVLGVKYSTTYQVTDGIITFSDVALGAVRLIIDDDTLKMKNDITGVTITFSKQTIE